MLAGLLLPDGCQLKLDEAVVEKDVVTVMVHSLQTTALCPDCVMRRKRVV